MPDQGNQSRQDKSAEAPVVSSDQGPDQKKEEKAEVEGDQGPIGQEDIQLPDYQPPEEVKQNPDRKIGPFFNSGFIFHGPRPFSTTL